MSDKVSWSDKARAVLVFATEAHNAAQQSKDGLVRAGSAPGGALLFSFAVECSIKGLIEREGLTITNELRIHSVHKLYMKLSAKMRKKASRIYAALISFDSDTRLKGSATKSLSACLQTHDDAFTNWRYNIFGAGSFYPVAMVYACVSLLTLLRPELPFTVGSRSSLVTQVIDGTLKQRQ